VASKSSQRPAQWRRPCRGISDSANHQSRGRGQPRIVDSKQRRSPLTPLRCLRKPEAEIKGPQTDGHAVVVIDPATGDEAAEEGGPLARRRFPEPPRQASEGLPDLGLALLALGTSQPAVWISDRPRRHHRSKTAPSASRPQRSRSNRWTIATAAPNTVNLQARLRRLQVGRSRRGQNRHRECHQSGGDG